MHKKDMNSGGETWWKEGFRQKQIRDGIGRKQLKYIVYTFPIAVEYTRK